MTSMTKLTIVAGIALILLGAGYFIGTGMKSVTALIPAFFGIPITILGFLASDETKRKVVAHIALFLALLGLLGGFGMGIPKLIKTGEASPAIVEQLIMGVICLVYILFGVRSFIAARKAQG